jgi:hypothetical protein
MQLKENKMGWYGNYHMNRRQRIADLNKGTDKVKVIRHCWRGNSFSGILWQVLEYTNDAGKLVRFAICNLMRYQKDRDGGAWMVKDMDEETHPFYYSFPLGYLALLTETDNQNALSWRAGVRKYHEEKKKNI